MTGKPARILFIAGSDSSGGAGIQADIKTATALGAYAMTAVTAVTVQDTARVHSVHPIPPDVVREQIIACLADIGADVIKTGTLGSAQTVRIVAETLGEHARGIPLVVDPVIASSSGTMLLDDDAVGVLRKSLLPLAALVTPNFPEAERLTAVAPSSPDAALRAAAVLFGFGAKSVLFKGGHGAGDCVTDVLIESETGLISVYESPRIESRNTHGTGCTLAAAIACGLGQGLSRAVAVERAHNFVQAAIRSAPGFGKGHGPLGHMHGAKDQSGT